EVEALCDRVIVIHRGRIVTQSAVADLMKPLNQFEIMVRIPSGGEIPGALADCDVRRDGDLLTGIAHDLETYTKALSNLKSQNIPVVRSESRTRSLEEYFIELVRSQADTSAGGPAA